MRMMRECALAAYLPLAHHFATRGVCYLCSQRSSSGATLFSCAARRQPTAREVGRWRHRNQAFPQTSGSSPFCVHAYRCARARGAPACVSAPTPPHPFPLPSFSFSLLTRGEGHGLRHDCGCGKRDVTRVVACIREQGDACVAVRAWRAPVGWLRGLAAAASQQCCRLRRRRRWLCAARWCRLAVAAGLA